MFRISCFEGSACLTYIVFGTVITLKFVYTCGCVFFVFGVVRGFVCEVSFECVVCGVCYVVFQFFKLLAIFCVDLLRWVSVMNFCLCVFLSYWFAIFFVFQFLLRIRLVGGHSHFLGQCT